MTNNELKSWLDRHKLSVEQLAAVLGVTFMAVVHWLDGRRNISKPISRLLKLFDKHPELIKEFNA